MSVRFVRNSAGFREILTSPEVLAMLEGKAEKVKTAAEAKGVTVNQGRVETTGVDLSHPSERAVITFGGTNEAAVSGAHAVGGSDGRKRVTRTTGKAPMPYEVESGTGPSRARARVRAVHPAGIRAELKYRTLGTSIDAARE